MKIVKHTKMFSTNLPQKNSKLGNWREVKLREVVKTNYHNIASDYPYKIIQYLDTGSITRGKIECFQQCTISEAPSRAKRLVKNGDIVYSNVRPIQRHYGFIKNPPNNLVVSTGFSVIKTDQSKADPLFRYYLLTSNNIVEELDAIAEGATSAYPSIRPSDIENLEITLPSLPEQKKQLLKFYLVLMIRLTYSTARIKHWKTRHKHCLRSGLHMQVWKIIKKRGRK